MLTTTTRITVDPSRTHQRIDGFGVNINGRYWDGGRLAPVLDLLVRDLGATIFRLDIYGKSNWIDPDGTLGKERALSRENLDTIYGSAVFQSGLATALHLNSLGIDLYVTLSGIVPPWMCADDGATLDDIESFCTMATDYASWLRKSGVKFSMFGPQNETNLGPPEGPRLNPAGFVALTRAMARHFDAAGLGDIRFVVAEEGGCGHEFLEAFNNCPELRGRIAAFGMHCYWDDPDIVDVVGRAKAGPHQQSSVWMSEYGDLDQSGENEFYFSWLILRRLFRVLRGGMNGALNWDAFDNYHDHDEAWTLYGLIRSGLRTYTPKKRYYACKHVYRFARPGSMFADCASDTDGVEAIAFVKDGGVVTVGMNDRAEPVRVIVQEPGMKEDPLKRPAQGFITTESQNCVSVEIAPHRPWAGDSHGWEIIVPPKSIFTVVAGVSE